MALVTIFAVAPTSAAPADIFSIAAPTVGSDPPHGTDLKTGDASVSTMTGALTFAATLSYTQQLRDFAAYASANQLRFDLWVRSSTQLSAPLVQQVNSGAINLRYIP
jgi:hypothetical protein